MSIPDPGRPDVKAFWSRVERSGGCWIWLGGKVKVDDYAGCRRVARYLMQGDFDGQLEKNSSCADDCCRPDHQKFVPYRPVEVRHPRRERDKKIRLLRGRGWKNRHIADELGISMGIVRRVLKDAE